MRYFIEFAYNGAPFHGWQRQPNAICVQEVLEEKLSLVLREDIALTGAGRTDTGVHARKMFAHFDVAVKIKDSGKIITALNRLCGKDICIRRIFPVHENAHARFDATRRTYKYFILYRKSPFFYRESLLSPVRLDIRKMNEGASLLLSTSDFTSFAKLHSDTRTNICKVDRAIWTPMEGIEGIVFTISADRFLRNMVRAIVGTLVDVGRGKLAPTDIEDIINRKDRCASGASMPPEGLFLWDVEYPYL